MAKTKEQLAKEKEAKLAAEINDMSNGLNGNMNIKVMTPDEYREYSKEKGLIMGRHPNQKTKCSIEELRALINSNWTPKMVMEKHGLSAEDLKQLVWKLSKVELRDKPIKFSIEGNFFGKEG